MGTEENRGERQDHDEAGDDETDATDEATEGASHTPRAEDGQLRRHRTRQHIGGGDAVLELGGRHPPPIVDAETSQQGDMRGRTAEPGRADPTPLRHDGAQ